MVVLIAVCFSYYHDVDRKSVIIELPKINSNVQSVIFLTFMIFFLCFYDIFSMLHGNLI